MWYHQDIPHGFHGFYTRDFKGFRLMNSLDGEIEFEFPSYHAAKKAGWKKRKS